MYVTITKCEGYPTAVSCGAFYNERLSSIYNKPIYTVVDKQTFFIKAIKYSIEFEELKTVSLS